MTIHLSLALLLLLLTPSPRPASAIVVRTDRTDAQSIELARRYDATARFLPDGCGTLIGERWVLTAAHVARGLSPFSPRLSLKGKEYRVRQRIFHPEGESDGHRPPKVDLALVELERPVEGIEPVALYGERDEAGKPVVVAGYGDFGPAGARLTFGDGKRRAATNVVESAENGRLTIDFDAPPDGTRLEGVGGPGDSGGPLFLETEEGLFLAGVSSASMGGRPGSYGVLDLYVRVSDFTDWIAETQKKARGAAPQVPEIRELKDGYPEGARGALLAAFFAGYASGSETELRAFEDRYRSQDSRRRNPAGAFTRRILKLRQELGSLRAVRVALLEPARWAVLVESERQGWQAVHFRMQEEGGGVRLMDLGLRPELPPAEKQPPGEDPGR